MRGPAFTEREDQLLRKYHEQGMSLSQQAFQLQRPYGSVCTRRQTLGLSYRNGGCGPAVATYEEIADLDYDTNVSDYDVLTYIAAGATAVAVGIIVLLGWLVA